MEKIKIIVSFEEQFAREVTLGVIVQKPPPIWQTLIPGMFLFDYLRRNKAVRQYTGRYMWIRKLALDAAWAMASGQNEAEVHSRVTAEIENQLNRLNLFSSDLAAAQQETGRILIEHYRKLLETEGKNFYDFIRHAYPSRVEYADHLRRLSAAEKAVNRAMISESQQLEQELQLEEEQVEQRRENIMAEIY